MVPYFPHRSPGFQAEPLLFDRPVGHVVTEEVLLARCRVLSGWCIAERCVDTLHADRVTSHSVLGVRLHPG